VKTLGRLKIVSFLLIGSSLALAQATSDRPIPALVKELGSSNARVREAAHQSLKERPEAAPALREALRSPDSEVARRAADILDHFDRAPLRELDSAIKEGRIERVIELAAQMPEGKYEHAIMQSVFGLARRIDAAYRKSPRGEKDKAEFMALLESSEFFPIKGKVISEATKAAGNRLYFVRANVIDLCYDRTPPAKQGNRFAFSGSVMVSGGSVRVTYIGGGVILALADVEIAVGGVANSLIVACGNVKIHSCANRSLIIAKGTVEVGSAAESRIISGKSVSCDERFRRVSAITENARNPLGYIRWSDAPKEKEKAAPKAK
jgi:hypothetical protein